MYNPFTKEFEIEIRSNKDDSKIIKEKILNLDFKTIMPGVDFKKIINPKEILHINEVNSIEVNLLKKWSLNYIIRDKIDSSKISTLADLVIYSHKDSIHDRIYNTIKREKVTFPTGWDFVCNNIEYLRCDIWETIRNCICKYCNDLTWDLIIDPIY